MLAQTSLYAPDVTTVYVPMIESESFRRDLGEQLTEAVVKEIELKTPFKVVGTPAADSILSARLVGDTKRVIVENRNDDPRVIEHGLAAEVTWLNRRREPLCTPRPGPIAARVAADRPGIFADCRWQVNRRFPPATGNHRAGRANRRHDGRTVVRALRQCKPTVVSGVSHGQRVTFEGMSRKLGPDASALPKSTPSFAFPVRFTLGA